MHRNPFRRAVFATLLSSLTFLSTAQSQTAKSEPGAWPAPGKTIKVVVPFPAGSGSDSLARMIGQ